MKKYYYSPFQVGQVFPETIGAHDHCQIDVTEEGFMFYIISSNPTNLEMSNYLSDRKKIRLTLVPDVMLFTFSFGNSGWFYEAPFNPHLSPKVNFNGAIEDICDHMYMGVIDSMTGKLVYSRLLGMSQEMKGALKAGISMLRMSDFDRNVYNALVEGIDDDYTVQEIANVAVVESDLDDGTAAGIELVNLF